MTYVYILQSSSHLERYYVGATAICDLASESIIVSDAHGVIKYWNAASETLYGWPAMAMVGQNVQAIGSLTHAGTEHFSELLREGRWEGVVRRHGLTGANVVAAVRQIVRRDSAGGFLDIVEFGRDAGSLSRASYLRMDAELQSSLAGHVTCQILRRERNAACDL